MGERRNQGLFCQRNVHKQATGAVGAKGSLPAGARAVLGDPRFWEGAQNHGASGTDRAGTALPAGTTGIALVWDAGRWSCCAQSCLLRKTWHVPCEVKQLELKWRTGAGLNFR